MSIIVSQPLLSLRERQQIQQWCNAVKHRLIWKHSFIRELLYSHHDTHTRERVPHGVVVMSNSPLKRKRPCLGGKGWAPDSSLVMRCEELDWLKHGKSQLLVREATSVGSMDKLDAHSIRAPQDVDNATRPATPAVLVAVVRRPARVRDEDKPL